MVQGRGGVFSKMKNNNMKDNPIHIYKNSDTRTVLAFIFYHPVLTSIAFWIIFTEILKKMNLWRKQTNA